MCLTILPNSGLGDGDSKVLSLLLEGFFLIIFFVFVRFKFYDWLVFFIRITMNKRQIWL